MLKIDKKKFYNNFANEVETKITITWKVQNVKIKSHPRNLRPRLHVPV